MESVKDKFKKMLAITNKITSLVKEGCCIFADYLLWPHFQSGRELKVIG